MSAVPKLRWTEAEYLAFERASQENMNSLMAKCCSWPQQVGTITGL